MSKFWVTMTALILGGASTAAAGDYGWSNLWASPYAIRGYGSSPYGLGMVPVPPYFALHPPVYYSNFVPRPYGFSPYALPPGVPPIEPVVEVKPVEIKNPHVKPKAEAEPASDRVAVTPLVIENPYVVEGQLVTR